MQVPEYLQADATPEKLAWALLELLQDRKKAAKQIEPFAQLHRQLRQNSVQRAAQHIIERGMH
jgi:lipid-A-disaccharide synthase